KRWSGIVKVIQTALPTDPNAPGITAVSRAIGSVNSKSGATVRLLRAGKPVPVDAILELFGQLRDRPFRTVSQILLGTHRVSPCPICRKPGSALGVLDRVGVCYGQCGKVNLDRLYDAFLAPQQTDAGK